MPPRHLASHRSLSQVELEFTRAVGTAWKAAIVISGLTLQVQWPALGNNIVQKSNPRTPNDGQ